MSMIQPIDHFAGVAGPSDLGGDAALRRAALKLEAGFLSLMLKESGLGETGAFGGGVGEEQFASFLRDIHAREMAEAGGIGLAESIFQALKARSGD